MAKRISDILLWFAALLMVSCDVHEFPAVVETEPKKGKIMLHLDYSLELPPYKDIIYNTKYGRVDNPSDIYDIRYIVNYYKSTNGKDFSQTPTGSIVVSKDMVEEINNDISLELDEGIYRFMVWTDYSEQGSLVDRRYSTDSFSGITLIFPHEGNNDYNDAFRGTDVAEVVAETTVEHTIAMERPMGKYCFIATDFDRFMAHAEEVARAEWEASRVEDPMNAPQQMPQVNINDFNVVIRYPGFMPHVFNMFTNRPADARTGVSFDSRIVRINDKEAELGFDYLFINGSEAPYTVSVEIYDKKGQLVGSSGSIDVPLMRSMLTTVRGDFLTSKAQGGVGVSPEFDGEFNIFIP